MTFVQGHVKRNPDNGDVAVRTQYPEGISPEMDAMAWMITTASRGPRMAGTDEVQTWVDVYVPEETA